MKQKTNQFARTAMMLLLAVLSSFMAVGTSFAAGGNPTNGNSGDEPTESETITIGKGDNYTDLPLTAQYKYALTQQLFSANEIKHAKGKIWSIAFRTEKGDLTRNYNVYLTHTDQSSMSSYSWQPVTEADCYFSGEVMFTSRQWNIIYFDKPFEYDGKSNIVVTVDDNTGRADGWGALTNAYFYGDGNHAIARSSTDIDPLDPASIENTSNKSTYDYKNQIQFAFGDYPTPAYLAVAEVGDVSAQIQCSLRGEAKAWNVRYRKVAAEGEEELRWTQESDLTTRSFTIEDLKAFTKYEVQVQAVFAAKEEGGEDILSAWTDPLVFTTNCCPVEEQADIIYAVNSNYSSWYGYAIQFVDITDENNPVEAAYINPVDYSFTGGKLTLCCGHKYKVNWIYDEEHSNVNGSFSLALYFEPGDLFYRMLRGDAPEETAELTTFVMDCTPYCAQMPQNVSVAGTTYNSATITFVSETKAGEVVYSTEADFDPNTATPTSLDFTALPASEDPWGGTPPNSSLTLTGLDPLTDYYVSVRSVCVADVPGVSRWSEPIKVTTGSRYDAPTQVIAEPVNSRTEKLSWSSRGNEKSHNLYYRKQGKGNPVAPSAIQTFGGGKGTGFKSGSWGEGIQSSYGDHPFSNTLFVEGIPAGSSFSFKAGNGKTGAGQTKFLYGTRKVEGPLTAEETMKQFDKKCLNDADRQARIDDLNALLAQLELKIANGEITQEEYDQQKAAIETEIASFNTLPTDAQKLEQMRTLEQNIENNEAALAALALKNVNGEITDEEYAEQKDALEAQNALYGAELSELRAITTNAENTQKDGFSITREKESANARSRGTGDDAYIFFIRHSDPNGVLLVKDLTITPPEQQGEWIVIPNVSGNSYMLTGLEPGTTYEVMVEPVYDGGTTGSRSPITVFTTFGEESEPLEGVFSVSKDKKVGFAKGNLRYSKDANWNDHWSLAEHQYDILGADNLESQEVNQYGNRFPSEDHLDLFCWSAGYSNNGTVYTYPDDSYYTGDFKEWGTQTAFTDIYGFGWSTMTKDEWAYLLSERENAATLKSFATVNGVKGLVLLPDEWNAPDGVIISEEMTAEQWATIEKTGAVFLPAAGTLTVNMEGNTVATVNDVNVVGSYWSSTPSETDVNAFSMTFTESEVKPAVDTYRRIGSAVRLVKCTELSVTTAESGFTTLVSTETLDFTNVDGLTAYIATNVDNTAGTVMLQSIDMVPANTPVVLKGNPSTKYALKTSFTTATPPIGNLLKGSATESIELAAGEAYILSDGKFYKNNAGIMPAGKAYLPAVAVASGVRQIIIVFDDETTAIRTLDLYDAPTCISIYNLQGQRVLTPGKGIYIINGKKVFIK